jgi:hypothetical protein
MVVRPTAVELKKTPCLLLLVSKLLWGSKSKSKSKKPMSPKLNGSEALGSVHTFSAVKEGKWRKKVQDPAPDRHF